jgi:aminopeptidase N
MLSKGLLFLWVLVVGVSTAFAQQPGADGIGDSLYPQMGNGGYDVQHYTLEVAVDVAANTIVGTAALEVVATQDLSAFNLDFNPLTIDGITVDGAAAEFSQNGGELTITPVAPLMNGSAFTVVVTYQGDPAKTALAADSSEVWRNDGKSIYAFEQPSAAWVWFPVNDHPLDKASYTFRITVEQPYQVFMNGLLEDRQENADGTVTYVWQAEAPMASYLVTLNIVQDFVTETAEGPNGLPITNYMPAATADQTSPAFARQSEMVAFFSDLFGAYPFESYGGLVVDFPIETALETQTLSVFDISIVEDGEEGESTVAHELVHQWFGDYLALADWGDMWLNEGFATYFEELWNVHAGTTVSMDAAAEDWYAILEYDLEEDGVNPPGKTTPDTLFDDGVYIWGGLTLYALQQEVGDEAFFDIIKTYAQEYGGKNVTTADFIGVAEQVSGEDLGDFFDLWLYSDTLPDMPGSDG